MTWPDHNHEKRGEAPLYMILGEDEVSYHLKVGSL